MFIHGVSSKEERVTKSAPQPPSPINLPPQTRAANLVKATLDYLIVLPALVFIAPLLLVIALLVKLDSPGPLIYRRRVLGRNGREFDAFKFRTMYVDGAAILAQHPCLQAELAQNYKLKCDPRVTRVGYFLRKFSLDELPQLINVLRREMSLVGPRMITPCELAMYGRWSDAFLTVLPGITGLWQVNGRSNTTYDERVHLDMTYIYNWSIWLDIKIIFLTVPAVLKGEGAY
ncbi:MAG: sugar transferase [Chloroflexota bacterium]